MTALRLLASGEWNKDPVLLAARRLIFAALGDTFEPVPLGSAAVFLNGTSYDKAHVHASAAMPIIRISNISDPTSQYIRTDEDLQARFLVESGDLLVSWSASFKSIIWPGPSGYLNQHIFKVTENPGFDRQFIRHAIEASFDKMQEQVVGIGMMHLRREAFLSHPIPRVPIAMQIEVARYLDSVERRAPRPKLVSHEKLAHAFQVVDLIEAIAGKVEEARRLRGEAGAEAEALIHRTVAKMIDSPNWDSRLLGDVLAEPPRNGLSPQAEVQGSGRPMLRINAVSSTATRYVDTSAAKYVSVSDAAAAPFELRHDDVFIVRYNGDINRVAKAAIYKGDNSEGAVFPDKLMRLRPNRSVMTPDFLTVALSTRRVRAQIEEIGKTTAGNIGISGINAKGFLVSVPPLLEQLRIVRELETLEHDVTALLHIQSEVAATIDALVPAVLDTAFRGEI